MPTNSHQPAAKLETFGRCRYLTATNRRCRSLLLDPDANFCPRHACTQAMPDDLRNLLTNRAHRFRCAHGINNSLADLYGFVAAGVITPRRASSLAYISSLLLRTLPAIEKESALPCYRPIHSASGLTLAVHQSAPQTAAASAPVRPLVQKNPSLSPASAAASSAPPVSSSRAPSQDILAASSPSRPPAPSSQTSSARPVASPSTPSLPPPASIAASSAAAGLDSTTPTDTPAVETPAANTARTFPDTRAEFAGKVIEAAKLSHPPFISFAKPALRYRRYD